MKRPLIIILLAMFAVSVLMVAPGFAAGVIEWKMQCAYPPGDAAYDVHAVRTAKLVEEATGGKVKVKLFPPGALCSVKEMANAIGAGMLDMGVIYGPRYAGRVPTADVEGGMPFSWTNQNQAAELFWDPKYNMIQTVRDAWAPKNIFYLMPYSCGTYTFLTNFPLKTIADFKGHKMRGMGASGEWLAKAGASATPLPGGEIYMALKLGTIDGTPFPTMALETLKLKEVVKYITFPGLVAPPHVSVVVNMESWKLLPPEARKILTDRKTMVDFYLANGAAYSARDEAALPGAYERGIKSFTMSDEELRKGRILAQSIWEKVAKRSKLSQKAVDILVRYMKDKGML
jgi:TRAP-type C4-dicarboxylate transport system substrate-binding protein